MRTIKRFIIIKLNAQIYSNKSLLTSYDHKINKEYYILLLNSN